MRPSGFRVPRKDGDITVGLRVMVSPVSPSHCSDSGIVPFHESMSQRPSKETMFVHDRIGKLPQRIVPVADEMSGPNVCIVVVDNNATN